MTTWFKFLAGIFSLAALDCGAAAPDAVTPGGCPTSQDPRDTVVGCELAPRVAMLGADDQALYVVNGARTFFAVARQTGLPTKLYHSPLFNFPLAPGTLHLSSAGFHGGKIYLVDQVPPDDFSDHALVALDVKAPGAPSLVTRVDSQSTNTLVFADGYVYFKGRQNRSSVAPVLLRAPLAGGPPQVIFAGDVDPFAVQGGYVYFQNADGAIRRAPIAGGADNLILPRLPPNGPSGARVSYLDVAVDDNYLYTPAPSPDGSAPHTLQRYAVTGGDSGTALVSISARGEIQLGAPTALRVDGNYVYFLLVNGLYRVKTGGGGMLEQISAYSTTTPPVFDSSSLYVTQQLGGDDDPLQGIILRIPK